MLIAGLDIETTGLKQELGHRIIEIAILTYDTDTEKLVDQYVQRIDPQRPIDPGASEVNHITYEMLVGMPTWEEVAPIVIDRLNKTPFMIAHNADFDAPFVGGELLRIGMNLPDVAAFCTMKNGRWACPDGKSPKLGELCFALGVEYDTAKAHGAEYDVAVMMECFFRGRKRGFFALPEVA